MGSALLKSAIAILTVLAMAAASSTAGGAGHCEVRLQFNAGAGQQLQRHEIFLRLRSGEARHIGQSRMDYIVNLGPNSLQVWFTGGRLSEITLRAGERDPEARLGYFFGPRPVRLERLNCLATKSPQRDGIIP